MITLDDFGRVETTDEWEAAIAEAERTGIPFYEVIEGETEQYNHVTKTKTMELVGKSVLDIACGEGFYARLMHRVLGAAEVVAIDLSSEMIKLADEVEAIYSRQMQQCQATRDPCAVPEAKTATLKNTSTDSVDTIRFLVVNAAERLPPEMAGHFDILTTIYLFNYTRTPEELLAMSSLL